MHMHLHPQIQAQKHVSELLCREDQEGRLLIVYFAGHGRADSNGRLLLAGGPGKLDTKRERRIDRKDIETTLGKAGADVLVILDCCCSGVLRCAPMEGQAGGGGSRRKFQDVTACTADQLSRSAGPHSFTTAMIWALKELAVEPGFTVRRLVRRLASYEDFPLEDREPQVFDSRFGPHEGDIWLAPWRGYVDDEDFSSEQQTWLVKTGQPTAAILDLRFHFTEHATDLDIEETAQDLKAFLQVRKDLRFRWVSFLDHKSYVENAGKHWLNLIRKKKKDVAAGSTVVLEPGIASDDGREGNDGAEVQCVFLRLLRVCRPVPAWHSAAYVMA